MALIIGSSMKEDLGIYDNDDDSPLAISSSMKEDLKREEKKLKDGSTIIGSACFEDFPCGTNKKVKENKMSVQVSAQKVTINFECESCGDTRTMTLTELIDEGAPICCDGDQMDFIDCDVDTQMHFG